MGKAVKGIGSAVGKIGSMASPLIGMLPGGGLINAGIGGLNKVMGAVNSPTGQALAGLAGGLIGAKSGAFDPKLTQTSNAATGTAGNYSNFLNSMLGSQSGAQSALQNMLAGRPGDPNSLSQYFNAGMEGNGQAQLPMGFTPQNINAGYQQQNVQGGFTPQNVNTQFQNDNILSTYQQNAPFSPDQVTSMFNSPEFQSAILRQVDTSFKPSQINFNSPEFQSMNLAGPQQYNAQQVNVNTPQFQNAQLNNVGLRDIGREMLATGPDMLQGFGERGNFGSIVNPAANAQAVQDIMGRQQTRDIADLRERFGNRALSTGAMQAESLYRAEAAPRAALAIDDIVRQNQAQQLTQRGQDIGAWQAGRGLDVQQLGAAGGQATQLNQALVAQRGQDAQLADTMVRAGLGMNDQQLQAAQMANQFGMQGAQLGMQGQIANQGAGFNAAQLNSQNQLSLNDQLLQQLLAQNQFGMQGAQMGLQADQANLQALMQAAGLNQQGALGMNEQLLQQAGQQNQFNQGNSQFAAQQALQAALANQGMGLNAAQFNDASNQFAAQQAMQAQLANQQGNQFGAQYGQQGQTQNNQFAQQAAQMQLQAMLANQQNQQAMAQQQMQAGQLNNQFGLDAQQQQLNALLQNQQLGNQWNMGLQGIGAQLQGQQLQGQQAALQQLFGGLNNMAGIGLAGAENVVGPSAGANFAAGAGAVGSLFNAFNQARSLGGAPATQAPAINPINLQALISQQGRLPAVGMTPSQFQLPVIR